MDGLSLSFIDIVALALTLLSVIFGFFRGFTRELLAVTAWLAAAFVAGFLYPTTSVWISDTISTNNFLVAGLAAIGVFLVLLFIFMLFGRPIWRGVRKSSFWLIDSVLGLFAGLVRGLLILCLLAIALSHIFTHAQRANWAQSSRVLPYADQGARELIIFVKDLPYELVQLSWFQDMMNDMHKRLGPQLAPSSGQPRPNISTPDPDLSV